uniref:NADPH-dependent 1-acyldihydroxyacetone phosphate reductase-like n=1 Tax=Tanacetum cinerariifolium TaxID=118510 RepID=A0A6L2M2H3_TANCI|nr:NADPH-dependent 1-acyldihydroxyacetone phosphate reductase-like [Tanacetum cinerariifolium]
MSDPKVVLVTGCAKGGIGYEYCKAFAEQNCHVIASDICQRMNDLSDLQEQHIETLELDVLSDESVSSVVKAILSKHGRIDVLINNAGIGSTGPLAELPLDEIKKAYEINTLGQLRMVQQVVPSMATRKNGVIVNIGSVVGKAPTPWAGSYCSSKAAVHAMSHTLRLELKPFGINVVLVIPGAIRSNLGSHNTGRLSNYNWELYKDFSKEISERARASQVGKSTDATIFARHIAKKVLSPKPPKQIVFGHMTALFAFLSASPLWVRDLFFTKRFNLDKKL